MLNTTEKMSASLGTQTGNQVRELGLQSRSLAWEPGTSLMAASGILRTTDVLKMPSVRAKDENEEQLTI